MTDRLFVYGTLRSDFHHPAHAWINRYFLLLGTARVQGKLYDCGEYPGAVPDAGNYFITGELYELRNAGEFAAAMRVLDNYEGYREAAPQNALFRRNPVNVHFNNRIIEAWIYWFNRDITGKPWIASGNIMER